VNVSAYFSEVLDDERHQIVINDSLDLLLISGRDIRQKPNGLLKRNFPTFH
jgi:hypothetical protein